MMFSRALLVALCSVYATSLNQITAPVSDDDCALYLTGPGRSSAYDYSLNLLKGNFAYDGQHTCITYEAINQAYLDARTRILVSQPKGDWKAEDFASVGELILDVSISLARTYGLTYEEIEKGLPLIDTSRTLIREVCPPVFSHVECRAGKYRRLDGLCNNLKHPTWGATMAPFQRLIGPLFSDGINAPRISHTGHDLPLSRVVSRTMHPDEGFHDHAGTVMVIAWGQFMDHDYTLTGTPLDPVHRNDPEECCKRPPHLKHPYCNEIRVPDDDYFYRLFGVKCIDFVRGFPSPRPGCRLGSRVPFNTLTGAIDGNTVYGVTEKFARKLRTGYGGFLRMNPVFKEYGLKDLLPLKLDIPDEGCTRPNKNMYCFEAGEIRVNEQLVLTVMHTLMAREHNRVAEALAAVNPHWDDESLFQEARRINIAEIQHITYNEFLPILLGKDVMEKFGLVLAKEGFWEGYDQEVNPDVIASFAAAAYRFGHSLLPTAVERWSKAHKFIASKRLSDLIRRPYDLYRAGVLDEYVMGLMNQVAQAMDDSITQEVTNHLFKKVGARFGMDLVSFNMQRGREFGIPGYMEFRKFCGLSGADTFQDLFGSMANETIRKYESIFEHPIDVDLWSGGVSERPLPGSMLGPTFACVIATQFSYSRRGDRFWFELPNQPSSFTPEQLAEIRKSRLARIICDNTDIIDTVQLYPMVLPDHELNPRVPCRSGIIPSMDFSKWADPAPFLGGAKEYMTHAYTVNVTNIKDNQTNMHCDDLTSENCVLNKTSSDIQQDDYNATKLITPANQNEKDSLVTCSQIQNNSNCLTNEDKTKLKIDRNSTNEITDHIEDLGNQIEDNEIALKYASKKSDNIKKSEKSKGHFKNSLKRKKRSLNRNDDGKEKTNAPGLFNVFKDQDRERKELNLPKFNPGEVISNLADFDVKTLHGNIKPQKLRRGNQRFYSNLNNRYLPKSEREDVSNENLSHQREKYENLHENQKDVSPLKQKQRFIDDKLKNKHYSQAGGRNAESEESDLEDYTNKENRSYEDDEDDDGLSQNYKGEILPKTKIPSIKKAQRGNRKYHINRPKPKKIYDESSENDPRDNIHKVKHIDEKDKNNNRLRSSIKKKKNPNIVSQKRNQKQLDDIKHINKKKSLYHEDENDTDSVENLKRNENTHTRKQPKNILRRQDERYYNDKQYHVDEAKKRDGSDDDDESYEKDDSDTESRYQDDEDTEEPNENFKKHEGEYNSKPSSNNKEQKQDQKYYDDKWHLPSSILDEDDEDDDNYGRNSYGQNKYNNENENSSDNFKKAGGIHSANIGRHNYNDKLYTYPFGKPELLDKNRDEIEKKENTEKANEYNEDDEEVDENVNKGEPSRPSDKITPLQRFKTPDIKNEDENENENVANLKYGNEQIHRNNVINDRSDIPSPHNKERQNLETADRSNDDKYVNLDRNSNEERDNYKNNSNTQAPLNKSTDIQDVDLGDFSYERLKLSDVGKIEPIKDFHVNYESDSLPKVISTVKPNTNDHYYHQNKLASIKHPSEFDKHVHINEDKEKPILHLNNENSSEESKKNSNEDLSDREVTNNANKYREVNFTKGDGVEDVKQQFERIPLDYNHAGSNSTKNTPPLKSDVSDGTLDTQSLDDESLNFKFTPDHNKYDENLKIKFGDVNIKLPDIKLPEDILAYSQDPESGNDEISTEYYNNPKIDAEQYSEEPKRLEQPENHYQQHDPNIATPYSEKPKSSEEEYDYFASYINKPNEKLSKETNAQDASSNINSRNGDDLYERFVRERFGRKDSFKERSEKLQEEKKPKKRPATKNQELFNTLQKAIKKTEDVQKEAEKSGDPNASYVWTLEYGEKL